MSKAIRPVLGGSTYNGRAVYAVLSGLTRKIKAGYAVRDGVHRQFYSAGPLVTVTYSGAHTISDVTVGGKAYSLYALTGSGTLTIEGGEVQYWMCGGGASGGKASASSSEDKSKSDHSGVGGSGGYINHGTLAEGTHTVVIGAGGARAVYASQYAGSTTSIGSHTASGATTNGQSAVRDSMVINGASGGGGAVSYSDHGLASTTYGYWKPSKGSGYANTYPFFSTDLSGIGAHCAGGGGGGFYCYISSIDYAMGGTGGEMGGDGAVVTSQRSGDPSGYVNGGNGGQKGGGLGGYGTYGMYIKSYKDGYAATFYGSGGGGGGHYYFSSSTYENGTGGAGYQGVAYVLVPAA